MNDLISRQAAIDIADDPRDCISVDGYWAWTERLKKLPAADVVEVVRCKDCKWWDNDGDAERCTHKYGGMWAKSDGYCSYGERAEA